MIIKPLLNASLLVFHSHTTFRFDAYRALKYSNIIRGLEEAGQLPDTEVFHAGTGYDGDDIVTSGGRVLGITARGETLKQALTTAYTAVDLVQFDGAYVRRDIGWRAIGT